MSGTKSETKDFWYETEDPLVYDGTATFYVSTSYYVGYNGIMDWDLQAIQKFLDDATRFIDANESVPIDRKDILLTGKNFMGETLRIRYQRPATPEEEDAYKRRQEGYKQGRREQLLAELAELAELDEEQSD